MIPLALIEEDSPKIVAAGHVHPDGARGLIEDLKELRKQLQLQRSEARAAHAERMARAWDRKSRANAEAAFERGKADANRTLYQVETAIAVLEVELRKGRRSETSSDKRPSRNEIHFGCLQALERLADLVERLVKLEEARG